MSEVQTIIVQLSEEDRKASHVPDWVFDLCHENDVFYEDFKTNELVQVLDLRPLATPKLNPYKR